MYLAPSFYLALKCATTRNLTNGVWVKPLWVDSAKKTAGTGARLLRALHARCQDQAGNSGAEAMMLNVGHFAGLCVGYAPKRHVDLARRRVPKRPTGPTFARMWSASILHALRLPSVGA